VKVSNESLAIGIPLTFPFVPSGFFYSFAQMERPNYTLLHADNGPIDTLRNDLVESALRIGATHLMMCDTDQIYPVNTIPKLLSHRLPVVGCMVHRRYPPFDPIMLKGKPGEYYGIEEWKPGDLVEVDATGAGCLMFDMQVFRNMPRPWFKFRKLEETDEGIGEDIGFCSDLKAAGYKIFVDTSLECGHLTTMCVNRQTHQLYKSMKIKQHKDALAVALQGEVVNT
jgi:hypothetical protein